MNEYYTYFDVYIYIYCYTMHTYVYTYVNIFICIYWFIFWYIYIYIYLTNIYIYIPARLVIFVNFSRFEHEAQPQAKSFRRNHVFHTLVSHLDRREPLSKSPSEPFWWYVHLPSGTPHAYLDSRLLNLTKDRSSRFSIYLKLNTSRDLHPVTITGKLLDHAFLDEPPKIQPLMRGPNLRNIYIYILDVWRTTSLTYPRSSNRYMECF